MSIPRRQRRRLDVTTTEFIGGKEKPSIVIVDYDPEWVREYQRHEARIRSALSGVVVVIEHIGSTSVPGLPAKPIIDILATVEDITAEEDYLPQLMDAGYRYRLRVRDPGHRMVRTSDRGVHVHLFEAADPRVGDYLEVRDHLRRDPQDRDLYAQTKRQLAAREWEDMNEYADAKTDIIDLLKKHARRI